MATALQNFEITTNPTSSHRLPALERSNGKLPSDYRQQFGPRVRALRVKAHLYQNQVAERMGVSRPFISKIESGRSFPGLDTQTKLAHALDMDLSDFMWEIWDKILYPKHPAEH